MRFPVSFALVSLLLMTPTLAHADIIEVGQPKPKPKKRVAPKSEEDQAEAQKPKGKTYEMRIHMSNNQASRDLYPLIQKRLAAYGYEMAPDPFYGDLYKKVEVRDEDVGKQDVFKHTFSFEIVKSSSNCFVVTKVVGENVRETLASWETPDAGLLPCELQVQQAMKAYADKNPAEKPAKDVAAIEKPFLNELKKVQDEMAAKEAAAKKAEEEVAAKKKAEAEAFKAQMAAADMAKNAGADSEGGSVSMGCSATASAPAFSALFALLAAVPFRRRKH